MQTHVSILQSAFISARALRCEGFKRQGPAFYCAGVIGVTAGGSAAALAAIVTAS